MQAAGRDPGAERFQLGGEKASDVADPLGIAGGALQLDQPAEEIDRVHHRPRAYPVPVAAAAATGTGVCYWTMREVPAARSDAICWKIVFRLVGTGSG